MKKDIRTLAALLIASAAFVACSSDDDSINENHQLATTGTYTMTIEASKGGEADSRTTRALCFDGETGALDATWEAGDLVYVYSVSGEAPDETLSAKPVATLLATDDGATTTLLGKFTNSYTPVVGARLRLKFLDADYASQDGTLDYIAANCDYATADVTITTLDGKQVKTTAATFQNQQAIVKFTLKDKATDAAISATSLTIDYGSATYTVTPADAASEFYLAIPGQTDAQIKLYATVGTDNYSYKKSAVTFENGSYYAVAVKMKKEIRSVALSTVTSSHIGWRIGSDGRAYEPSGEMPEGVTAEAMICYVEADHHGYAIELNDSRGPVDVELYQYYYFIRKAAIPGVVSPYGWKQPSLADWTEMIAHATGEYYQPHSYEVSSAACQAFYNLYNATGVAFNYGKYWTGDSSGERTIIIIINQDGSDYDSLYKIDSAYGLYYLRF